MNKTLKKNIGILHLWLGLGSGLIVFIAALTGSLLVFEKEIDKFINPEYYNVSTIGTTKKTIDYCTDLIQKQYAVKKINRIYTFNDPARSMQIIGKDLDGKTLFFQLIPIPEKFWDQLNKKADFLLLFCPYTGNC